jgi:hypothetical protein
LSSLYKRTTRQKPDKKTEIKRREEKKMKHKGKEDAEKKEKRIETQRGTESTEKRRKRNTDKPVISYPAVLGR